MKSISKEIKENILNEIKNGGEVKAISIKYGVARSTVNSWLLDEEIVNSDKVLYKEYRSLKKKYDELLRNYTMITTLHCFADSPISLKKQTIDKYYDIFPFNDMCKLLNIAKGTAWAYHNAEDKRTEQEQNADILKKEIKKIYEESKGKAGYGMTFDILKKRGFHTSYEMTSKLMKELELKSTFRRTRVLPKFEKINNKTKLKDYVKQNFEPISPNMIWTSDVTELVVKDNKFYLCIILDLFAKRIVAYRLSSKNDTSLTVNTFKDAFESRNRPTNLIFHSDQGSNYVAKKFMNLLLSLNVTQSFSRPGCPYDNACTESFFSKYKQEDYNSKIYTSFKELCMDVDSYMGYYNNYRLKRKIRLTPVEIEEKYYSDNK